MGKPLALVAALPLTLCLLGGSAGARTRNAAANQEGSAQPQPCVILKRMGPADQVTSHLYSFGLRGKQYQYEEGQFPEGIKFHGRLTDHDVRKIQKAGGRIEIVDAHYTDQELEQARKGCGLSTSGSPVPALSSVTIQSNPPGADITIDGNYSGSTPSHLKLAAGSHVIEVSEAGFSPWKRTISVNAGGQITVDATLQKTQ